jgi:hypothetical protein
MQLHYDLLEHEKFKPNWSNVVVNDLRNMGVR